MMSTGQDLTVQGSTPDPALCAPLLVAVRPAIDAIQDETHSLKANPTSDLKLFEYGKSQALLELTRARSHVSPSSYTDELKDALEAAFA